MRPTAPRWCANTTSTTTASRSTASPSRSVAAAHGEETPIDGYKGAYIDEIAKRVIDEANADGVDVLSLPRVDGGADQDGNPLGEGDSEQREEFRKRAVPMMFDEIQRSMKNFRVNFDVWFHENSLYSDGEVDQAIADLRARGDIYEKDGATWFESTKHGDDKDRVIIKSDGNYAYFAGRHRLLPQQAPPRDQPGRRGDLHARRRPPRLHRPHDGHVRGLR